MLDIQIFHISKPIYDGKDRVGEEPHLLIGTYTALTKEEMLALDKAATTPSPQATSVFGTILCSLGKRFYAAQLTIALEQASHPTAKKHLTAQLRKLFPNELKKLSQLRDEKSVLKSLITKQFSPEEQVKMMMVLKNKYDKKKANNEISSVENEIFARGIAECVQTIKDLPQEEKSPIINHLCISGTHRRYKPDYSRS